MRGRERGREGRSRFSINLPEMSRKGKKRKDAPVYWLAGCLGRMTVTIQDRHFRINTPQAIIGGCSVSGAADYVHLCLCTTFCASLLLLTHL